MHLTFRFAIIYNTLCTRFSNAGPVGSPEPSVRRGDSPFRRCAPKSLFAVHLAYASGVAATSHDAARHHIGVRALTTDTRALELVATGVPPKFHYQRADCKPHPEATS